MSNSSVQCARTFFKLHLKFPCQIVVNTHAAETVGDSGCLNISPAPSVVCLSVVRPSQLQPIARHTWQLLCSLKIHCDFWSHGCQEVVQLKELSRHTSTCQFATAPPGKPVVSSSGSASPRSEPPIMLQYVVNAPPTQPLTPDEEKALGVMLRRKVHDAGTTIALPVYTGGRPRHISLTPVTGTSREEVEAGPSVRTMTRRHDILRRLQVSMTGSEGLAQEQLVFDIQQSSRAEREQLLFRSHLATAVSPEDTMAMALHLRLTNEQQCKMRLGQNSGICSWRPKGKCESWPRTGWVTLSLEQRWCK